MRLFQRQFRQALAKEYGLDLFFNIMIDPPYHILLKQPTQSPNSPSHTPSHSTDMSQHCFSRTPCRNGYRIPVIHGAAYATTIFGNSAIGLAIVRAVVPDTHVIGSATGFHFVETVWEINLTKWAAGWEVGSRVKVDLGHDHGIAAG
jgi:hypothetical protein